MLFLILYFDFVSEDNYLFPQQDKMDGFVPAHFLGWYIKVGVVTICLNLSTAVWFILCNSMSGFGK